MGARLVYQESDARAAVAKSNAPSRIPARDGPSGVTTADFDWHAV
jgi:hypothetical protein